MIRTRRSLFLQMLLALVLSFEGLVATSASAQVPTGTPPFGSFGGGPDVINLANLNSHITVPIIHKPGRGMNFNYDLSYDTSVWYPVGSSGSQSWQPVSNFGWRPVSQPVAGLRCLDGRADGTILSGDQGRQTPGRGDAVGRSQLADEEGDGAPLLLGSVHSDRGLAVSYPG